MIIHLTINFLNRVTSKKETVKEYHNFSGPIPRKGERIHNMNLPIGITMLVDEVVYEYFKDSVEVEVRCI